MKHSRLLKSSYLIVLSLFLLQELKAKPKGKHARLASFNPTEIWPDADGNHIQAHGGGIIKIKKTYFW